MPRRWWCRRTGRASGRRATWRLELRSRFRLSFRFQISALPQASQKLCCAGGGVAVRGGRVGAGRPGGSNSCLVIGLGFRFQNYFRLLKDMVARHIAIASCRWWCRRTGRASGRWASRIRIEWALLYSWPLCPKQLLSDKTRRLLYVMMRHIGIASRRWWCRRTGRANGRPATWRLKLRSGHRFRF